MIMLSKFSNFPDKLSKNDKLREYELSGSGCTLTEQFRIPYDNVNRSRIISHAMGNLTRLHQCQQQNLQFLIIKGPFTLNDCESDVGNICVLLVSIELLTSSNVKHQKKILRSLSQLLSLNAI